MPTAGHDNYATTKLMLGIGAGATATCLALTVVPVPSVALAVWVFAVVLAAFGCVGYSPTIRANIPLTVGVLLGIVGWLYIRAYWASWRETFNWGGIG